MTAPSKTFVIKGVGEAIITSASDGSTVARLLRLGDMKLSLNFPTEKIYGGDGLYPFDTIDKERTATVSFTNNEFDPDFLKAAMGATVTPNGTTEVQVMGEAKTIPSDTPYTVDLANKTTAIETSVKVRYADTGQEFTKTTTPTTGQFSYATGTLTFASADAGKNILIDYKYTVTDGTLASVLTTGQIPVVQIVHVSTFKDASGNDMKLTATIYRAKANGTMEINRARGTAATHALEFEILDPGRPDKKMIDFAIARV